VSNPAHVNSFIGTQKTYITETTPKNTYFQLKNRTTFIAPKNGLGEI